MEISVIVAAHKNYEMPEEDMYVPVQVGAAGKDDIGYVRDDAGDNISDKNNTYSELTGMYYAWKNMKADYLGLVHYRRYFASLVKKGNVKKNPFQNVLTRSEAEQILSEVDIVVPNKRKYYIESLYSHYDHTLDGKHLRVAYKIIADYYPEYIGYCNRVYRRSWGYMFNMMIARRDLWDEYCTWVFDILAKMEDRLDLSSLDAFESRVYGRVSEILFNVWLEYKLEQGVKIREVKCIHMENVNWLVKGTSFLKAKFLGKKYNKSF